MNIIKLIDSALLPIYCITCGKVGSSYMCKRCLKFKYKINFNKYCHVCGNSSFALAVHKECLDSTNLDDLYFFCEYNESAKKIIEQVKYGESFSIIDQIALNMSNYFKFLFADSIPTNLVITYVPSFWRKENTRGFNQSKLLAKKISFYLNIECVDLLNKLKATKKQAGSTKKSRQEKLNKTFGFSAKNSYKKILIIDDVHTTGATLNECASVLKENGVEEVIGFTFAKSLNYSHGSG